MTSELTALTRRQAWLDRYLGLLQFLFLLTWIVYVIFLGDLLERAGLPKRFAPRLLLIDQLLFACCDVVLGLYADRSLTLLRRLTPLILTLNLLACLIFASLPTLAAIAPSLLIAATVVWVVTSTVLRAPLYGAIARRSSNAAHGTAWSLAGMGLASMAAPYLGVVLKGMDPGLPLLLSGVALALATLGFGQWERAQPTLVIPASAIRPHWRDLRLPMFTLLLLGAAFQLHFFVNAAPLFKLVADPDKLTWLMPIFWGGFSLAVYPGMRLLRVFSPHRLLAFSSLLGAGACLACMAAPGLVGLILLQAIAGAAWGLSFLSALELAGATGHQGRESTFIGLIFASLALAAAWRIGLNLADIQFPAVATQALAAGLWTAGAVSALAMAGWHARRTPSPHHA